MALGPTHYDDGLPKDLKLYQRHNASRLCEKHRTNRGIKLEESLRDHGQLVDIQVYLDPDGTPFIIDGWTRFTTLVKMKLEPRFKRWYPFGETRDEIDDEIYVVAREVQTKQGFQTVAQRIALAEEMGTLRPAIAESSPRDGAQTGTKPKTPEAEDESPQSTREVARAAGISNSSAFQLAQVKASATPKVKELQKDGTLSVKGCFRLAKLSPGAQDFAAEFIRKSGRKGKQAPLGEAIEAAKEDERARNRPTMKDKVGAPVPEHLHSIFEAREMFDDLSARVTAMLRDVAAVREHPAGIRFAQAAGSRHIVSLQDLHASLRGNMPHAVCPRCEGRMEHRGVDCKGCQGKGWVSAGGYDAIKSERKAG